jgi:hypothetical protein
LDIQVSFRTNDYMPRRSLRKQSIALGGHLKTGHTWPRQNRPTELDQDKSIYNPPMAVSANIFSQFGVKRAYTGQAWAEDMATRGRDQSADPGPEWRAAQAAPLSGHSGGKR